MGIIFQRQARKHLHGLYLACPFLLEKKPGSLVGNSEWSFHNFELSNERVCLLVLIEMEPPLSGEEIIVKHVSLAEALCVIKDDNYSSMSGVKPRALSRHEQLRLSCPVCKNTQSPLWMGKARQLCSTAKSSFCEPSPLDGLTWKPHPGELGQTLHSVLPLQELVLFSLALLQDETRCQGH